MRQHCVMEQVDLCIAGFYTFSHGGLVKIAFSKLWWSPSGQHAGCWSWIYHNSEKAAWGNIVMDQIRLSALIVSVHSPTEASSKLLFPNYDNSKWPACWLLLGFIIILKKQHEAMQWWACMSADYIDTNNGGKNNNQCHQTECQVKMNCPSWASFKLSLPSREPTLNLRSNFCEHENGFPWSLCLICQPILNW